MRNLFVAHVSVVAIAACLAYGNAAAIGVPYGAATLSKSSYKGRCPTINQAVLNSINYYSRKECNGGIEGSYGVYSSEKEGFVLDEHDMSFGQHDARPEWRGCNPANCVPFTQPRFSNGRPLVALVHNHPAQSDGAENSWPSVADVKSAVRYAVDVFVVDCSDRHRVLRIDCRTGAIKEVLYNGEERPYAMPSLYSGSTEYARQKGKSHLDDGDIYDPVRFGELKSEVLKELGIGKAKEENAGSKVKIPDTKQSPFGLHSLNLDDPNGDWCKCEERGGQPGCDANMEASEKGYVIFGCTKCKKVNVKYAKMALALEQKMKDAGVKVMWHGPNAEANARKAVSESNK